MRPHAHCYSADLSASIHRYRRAESFSPVSCLEDGDVPNSPFTQWQLMPSAGTNHPQQLDVWSLDHGNILDCACHSRRVRRLYFLIRYRTASEDLRHPAALSEDAFFESVTSLSGGNAAIADGVIRARCKIKSPLRQADTTLSAPAYILLLPSPGSPCDRHQRREAGLPRHVPFSAAAASAHLRSRRTTTPLRRHDPRTERHAGSDRNFGFGLES
jgi:hypothetical protein